MPLAWDITSTGAAAGSGGCCGGGLRDRRLGLRGRVHLPVQAGRLRPGQPVGRQQLPGDLRHQPAVAGRGRTLAADRVRRLGRRHHEAQPLLLGSHQAHPVGIQGGSVHVRLRPSSTRWSPGTSTSGTCPPRTSRPRPRARWCRGRTTPGCRTSTLAPLYLYGINYFPTTSTPTADGGNAGKIFQQLYVRQAIQTLVDQPLFDQQGLQGLRRARPTGRSPSCPRPTRRPRSRATPTPMTSPRPRACLRATVGTSSPAGPPRAPTRVPGPTSAGPAFPQGAS